MRALDRLTPAAKSRLAIGLLMLGMFCISVNDMTIKRLSGDYPLHQMVFLRSAIAICFSLIFVQFEGGWRSLWPARPGLQALRAGFIVCANISYFAALSVLPLGTATALFFVAPLYITLLSIPVLGEKVGRHRFAAVGCGFAGVLVIVLRPDEIAPAPLWAYALPVFAALAYAGTQILTRALGATATASAMATYLQGGFILVSLTFGLIAGDGRYVEMDDHPTLVFLLRAWVWPTAEDWVYLLMIGVLGGLIGYSMSQAYRLGDAATVSPYEYVLLPMALFWGWAIWGEVPDWRAALGIAMILGAGLYVFVRERARAGDAPVPVEPKIQR